eukprot:TRINITY_DN113275_c0_g1_i1.p1 TRINITY_DN113275_c0_g1~~TRINITY_DN113275_c0_g1_i1.p1  ORF type:complete len:125 (+),score=8.93 TRINITY_DN113275_c0_g1_i1:51-425(+)
MGFKSLLVSFLCIEFCHRRPNKDPKWYVIQPNKVRMSMCTSEWELPHQFGWTAIKVVQFLNLLPKSKDNDKDRSYGLFPVYFHAFGLMPCSCYCGLLFKLSENIVQGTALLVINASCHLDYIFK